MVGRRYDVEEVHVHHGVSTCICGVEDRSLPTCIYVPRKSKAVGDDDDPRQAAFLRSRSVRAVPVMGTG